MNNVATVAVMAHTNNTMDAPEKVAAIVVTALKQDTQEVFIGQLQSFLHGLMAFFRYYLMSA